MNWKEQHHVLVHGSLRRDPGLHLLDLAVQLSETADMVHQDKFVYSLHYQALQPLHASLAEYIPVIAGEVILVEQAEHLVPDSCMHPYQGRPMSEQVPSLPHASGWDVALWDEISPVQVSQDLG